MYILHLFYFVYIFHLFFQFFDALGLGLGPLYFPETAGRAKNCVFCKGVKLGQERGVKKPEGKGERGVQGVQISLAAIANEMGSA